MSTIDLAYSARVIGGAPLAAAGQPLGDTTQVVRPGGGTVEAAIAAEAGQLARHQAAIAAIGAPADFVNLFRRAHVTLGEYIYLPQGGVTDAANYYLSEPMRAAPGDYTVALYCTWRALAGDGTTVLAEANVDAGGTFTVPAGTEALQISSDTSVLAGQMLVPGDTLPPVFVAPGWEDPATTHRFARSAAARVLAVGSTGRSLIVLGDVTRHAALDQASGGSYPADDYALTAVIDVEPGATYTMTDGRLVGWFDGDDGFLGFAQLPATFVVPVNATGLRLQLAMTDLGAFRLGPGLVVPPRDFERRADRANILDPGAIVHGEAIDDAGDTYAQAGWARTGRMRVDAGDFIALSIGTNSLAWHDASGAGIASPYHWQATGSVAGAVLTVTAVAQGRISIGSRVTYAGAGPNLYVVPGGTGRGGAGTYNLAGYQGAPVADLAGAAAVTCAGGVFNEHVWIERPPGAMFAQFQAYPITSLDLATVKLASWGEIAAGASPLVGSVAFGADPSTVPFYGQPLAIVGNSQVANLLFQAWLLRTTGMALVLNSGHPGYDIGALADVIGTPTMAGSIAATPGQLCGAKHVLFVEGHNEYGGQGRQLGATTDDSSVDSTAGKMRLVIERLFAIDDSINLVVAGPTYRAACTIFGTAYTADTTPNGRGVTGEQINATMQTVSQAEGVGFSDLRHNCSFNAMTVMQLTGEGLHWSLPIGAPRVGRALGASFNAAG